MSEIRWAVNLTGLCCDWDISEITSLISKHYLVYGLNRMTKVFSKRKNSSNRVNKGCLFPVWNKNLDIKRINQSLGICVYVTWRLRHLLIVCWSILINKNTWNILLQLALNTKFNPWSKGLETVWAHVWASTRSTVLDPNQPNHHLTRPVSYVLYLEDMKRFWQMRNDRNTFLSHFYFTLRETAY